MVRLSGCDGKGQCERVSEDPIRFRLSHTVPQPACCCCCSPFPPPPPFGSDSPQTRQSRRNATSGARFQVNLDAITWTTSTELTQDAVSITESMAICIRNSEGWCFTMSLTWCQFEYKQNSSISSTHTGMRAPWRPVVERVPRARYGENTVYRHRSVSYGRVYIAHATSSSKRNSVVNS